jgi:type I restriction enzyme M protein
MEPSEYKNYVLVLLFIKYVSDMYGGERNALVVVPEGSGYSDLLALTSEIGEGIDNALGALANANESLQGVINNETVFFNNEDRFGKGSKMDKKLKNLLRTFDKPELDFSKNKAEGDDILGDAYEYFMKNFAADSGKSKGNFFTPAEVSRIMAKVIKANEATGSMQSVYDPTCGSGSLLLRVEAETPNGISIYGQEYETSTGVMSVLNMWLHGSPEADIKYGSSTLSDPMFEENGSLKRFDYVVANPPFSYKEWTDGLGDNLANEEYGRFEGFGVPPEKNGDYAFMLHIIKSLKSTGKGAVILPHGVLFRGNAEASIRENILKRGYIKGIIGLPANLFYGTGIPASLIIIDKENAENRNSIFIIDASKGFIKDGNKNRLRERDLHFIVDTFNNEKEVEGYSRMVPFEEIKKNEYNLNIPRYIDSSDVDDLQDIDAHLNGGIPNTDIETLQSYWDVCPDISNSIFKDIRIIFE